MGKYPSIAFDNTSGVLYASDATSLSTLNVKTGKLDKIINNKGTVIHTDANQLLYVQEANDLINYDVFTNKLSRYDAGQKSWQNRDTAYSEPRYWHNNKFYNPIDHALYTFGGYGFYSYKNAFFKYDNAQAKWLNLKTSGSIPPRYLGALGLTPAKDKALIFGGYGSMSGKQEISPQSFYDLYSFDLRSHEVKKVWEAPPSLNSGNVVFSNSLVINDQDSCFYVLSFPKDKYKDFIKLRSYSLSRPVGKDLGDSISFLFHDVHSFCDLFSSKATKELIAVTAHKEGDQYKVHVYSINYPPLKTGDIIQVVTTQPARAANYYFIIIGGVLSLTILAIFIFRKKRRNPSAIEKGTAPADHPHTEIFIEAPEEKLSTIDLFGGFQVVDKSGIDITHKFTSTLKELLVLILLHSVKFRQRNLNHRSSGIPLA